MVATDVFGRHELPVFSPMTASHLASALRARTRPRRHDMEVARELLAQRFEARDVWLVDSGRSALQLAIGLALSRARSRVVALPAFQCYELASAAVGADCRVALYDVDPLTLQPDMASLTRALDAGAGAVVIAPLYGIPMNWDAVRTAVAGRDTVVIEDAAQGHGAEWQGQALGSLGDVSVVSFGRGKGWTAGRGGALLLRDNDVGRRARSVSPPPADALHNEAVTATVSLLQIVFGRPSLYGIPADIPALGLGETRYRAPAAPRGAHELSAALLLATDAASQREVLTRRSNAERWRRELPPALQTAIPRLQSGATPGYLRFPLVLDAHMAAKAATAKSQRVGIARSYPKPLNELPAMTPLLVDTQAAWPGAASLAERVVTLPTHSRLSERGRSAILALIRQWVPR